MTKPAAYAASLRVPAAARPAARHAHRILGSYEDGERAKVEVLRKRKRTTLEWTVPERDRWRERPHRTGPERGGSSGWS